VTDDPQPTTPQSGEALLKLLTTGEVVDQQLHPRASNYTFVVRLRGVDGLEADAIYKPRKGEAPLRDFPEGTLYCRERATYVLAQALGWDFVPTTIVRDGPYGIGVMQRYVDHQPQEHYFTLKDDHLADFKRICLFDLLANNADRKAGHCLLDVDGRIWGIDHGLTFHTEAKLRTVIWDFAGEPVPPDLAEDIRGFLERMGSGDPPAQELRDLLHPREMEALQERLELVAEQPIFPEPSTTRRSWPWPML
jgi:hypothetical protein